jgi:ABC-type hemin transport system substrate-binding protein
MPLTPYLNEGVFDPKAIEAMHIALEAVCKSLQLSARGDSLTQVVAQKIVEIASTGERDPQRLRDLTLHALKEADQHSA